MSVPYGLDRASNVGDVLGDVSNMELAPVTGLELTCVEVVVVTTLV